MIKMFERVFLTFGFAIGICLDSFNRAFDGASFEKK